MSDTTSSLFNQPFGVSEQHHFQKLLNSKPSLAIFQTIQLHVLLFGVSAVIPAILPSFLVELMVSKSCTTWNAWKVCQIVGTPMKFNSSPLKNGDWEDKPFLLGFSIFFIGKNVKLQGSLYYQPKQWTITRRIPQNHHTFALEMILPKWAI